MEIFLKNKNKIWICYVAAEMNYLRFKATTSYLTILADFPFVPFDTLTTELIDFICTLTTVMTRVTGTLIDIWNCILLQNERRRYSSNRYKSSLIGNAISKYDDCIYI